MVICALGCSVEQHALIRAFVLSACIKAYANPCPPVCSCVPTEHEKRCEELEHGHNMHYGNLERCGRCKRGQLWFDEITDEGKILLCWKIDEGILWLRWIIESSYGCVHITEEWALGLSRSLNRHRWCDYRSLDTAALGHTPMSSSTRSERSIGFIPNLCNCIYAGSVHVLESKLREWPRMSELRH